MTGFEPATTRPPDAYSNRTELHPVPDFVCLRVQRYSVFLYRASISQEIFQKISFFIPKLLKKQPQGCLKAVFEHFIIFRLYPLFHKNTSA